jgi:hypothetical protein
MSSPINTQLWTSAMEKQVQDRVQTVLTDKLLLSVYQRFGGDVFRRSSVFHGLGKFLRQQDIKGKVCFEIGTWNALTSAVLSRHFEKVVTIDIVSNKMKHKVLDHLGIKNVECIDIESNEDKPRVLEGMEFDFAYLDGDHANDSELDWELTRHCGRVLFQEVWVHQSPVWELVHSLPDHEVTYGGAGLALWRRSE